MNFQRLSLLKLANREHAAAALGYIVTAVISLRGLLFEPGMVTYSFEWYIPYRADQIRDVFIESLQPWNRYNFGTPNIYPGIMPLDAMQAAISWLGGPAVVRILLFLVLVLSPLLMYSYLRAWGFGRTVSFVAAGSVIFNPFVANHLAAGHTPFLISFIVAPAILLGLDRVCRNHLRTWYFCALLVVLGVQMQALLWVWVLALSIGAIVYRSRESLYYVGLSIIAYVCTNAFWILPLLANRGIEVSALVLSSLANDQLTLATGSRAIIDAVRLEPYGSPLTMAYLSGLNLGLTAEALQYLAVSPALLGLPLVVMTVTRALERRLFFVSTAVTIVSILLIKGTTGLGGREFAWAYEHLRVLSVFRETYHFGFPIILCVPIAAAILLDSLRKQKWEHLAVGAFAVGVLAWGLPIWWSGDLMGWAHPVRMSADNDSLYSSQVKTGYRRLVLPNAGSFRSIETLPNGGTGVDADLIYARSATFGNWLPLNALGVAIDHSIDNGASPELINTLFKYGSIKTVGVRRDPLSMFESNNWRSGARSVAELLNVGFAERSNSIVLFRIARQTAVTTLPSRADLWFSSGMPLKIAGVDEVSSQVESNGASGILTNFPRQDSSMLLLTFYYQTNSPIDLGVVDPQTQRALAKTILRKSLRWTPFAVRIGRSPHGGTIIWRITDGGSNRTLRVRNVQLLSFGEWKPYQTSRPLALHYLPAATLIAVAGADVVGPGVISVSNSRNWALVPRNTNASVVEADIVPGAVYTIRDSLPMVFTSNAGYESPDPIVALESVAKAVKEPIIVVEPKYAVLLAPGTLRASVSGVGRNADDRLALCENCETLEPGDYGNRSYDPTAGWVSGNISSNWVAYYNSDPGPFTTRFLYTTGDQPADVSIPVRASGEGRARVFLGAGSELVVEIGHRVVRAVSLQDRLIWLDLGRVSPPSAKLRLAGRGVRLIDRIVIVPDSAMIRKYVPALTYDGLDPYGFATRALACKSATSDIIETVAPIVLDQTARSNWNLEGHTFLRRGQLAVQGIGGMYRTIGQEATAGAAYSLRWRYKVTGDATIQTSLQLPSGSEHIPPTMSQRPHDGYVVGSLNFALQRDEPSLTLLVRIKSNSLTLLEIRQLVAVPTPAAVCDRTAANSSPVTERSEPVQIIAAEPGLYDIVVDTKKPTNLVLNENFSPLWRVYDEHGQGMGWKHFPANGYANAWNVSKAGVYHLRLYYGDGQSFRIGLIITTIGFLLISITAGFFAIDRLRRSPISCKESTESGIRTHH